MESRSACRDHVIVAAPASRMAEFPAKHLTRYPRQTAIARHGSASCEEDKLHKGLSLDRHGGVIERSTDLASRPSQALTRFAWPATWAWIIGR